MNEWVCLFYMMEVPTTTIPSIRKHLESINSDYDHHDCQGHAAHEDFTTSNMCNTCPPVGNTCNTASFIYVNHEHHGIHDDHEQPTLKQMVRELLLICWCVVLVHGSRPLSHVRTMCFFCWTRFGSTSGGPSGEPC